MTPGLLELLMLFLFGLVVSTIVIYVIVSIFGEEEGPATAVAAALIGTIIYALASYFLGQGILAAAIGGFVWLAALGALYNMGWPKAIVVAFFVWLAAALVSYVVPTVAGPL